MSVGGRGVEGWVWVCMGVDVCACKRNREGRERRKGWERVQDSVGINSL